MVGYDPGLAEAAQLDDPWLFGALPRLESFLNPAPDRRLQFLRKRLDVDGHRFDVRIGYVRKSNFNLTWYHTDPVYAEVPTMDRWQVDYIVKF